MHFPDPFPSLLEKEVPSDPKGTWFPFKLVLTRVERGGNHGEGPKRVSREDDGACWTRAWLAMSPGRDRMRTEKGPLDRGQAMAEGWHVKAPWTYAWRVRTRDELHRAELDVPVGFAIASPRRLKIVHGEKSAIVLLEDVDHEPKSGQECVSIRMGTGWSELCTQLELRVGCCVVAWPMCVGQMGMMNHGSALLKWVCGLRRSNANQATRDRLDWSQEDHLQLPARAAQALEQEAGGKQDKMQVCLVDIHTGQEAVVHAVRVLKATPSNGKQDSHQRTWQLQGEGWMHFHAHVVDPEAKYVEVEVWPQSFGRMTRLAMRVLYRTNGFPIVDHAVTYGEEELDSAELTEEEMQGYNTDDSEDSVVSETQDPDEKAFEAVDGEEKNGEWSRQTGWTFFQRVWSSYMPDNISLRNGKLWCHSCGAEGFTVLAAMQHNPYCTRELLASRPQKVFPWEKRKQRSVKNGTPQNSTLAAKRNSLKRQERQIKVLSEPLETNFGYVRCLICGSRTVSRRSYAYHIAHCAKRMEDNWEEKQMGWPRCPLNRFCGKLKGHNEVCNSSAKEIELALEKEHENIVKHVRRYCEKMSEKFGQLEIPQAKQEILDLFGEVLYEWEPNVYCKKLPAHYSFSYMLCRGPLYHQVESDDVRSRKVFSRRENRNGTGQHLPGSLEYLLKEGPHFQVLVTEDHVRPRGKGVGVVAMQKIPVGSFVMEYGGEKITTREATRREEMYKKMQLKDIYLYDMTEPWIIFPGGHMWRSSKLRTVDATLVGNFARFINHSCVPNLKSVEVGVREGHSKVVFYATRNIGIGEELTIDYDPDFQIGKYMELDHSKRKKCLCGMGKLCRGWTF